MKWGKVTDQHGNRAWDKEKDLSHQQESNA